MPSKLERELHETPTYWTWMNMRQRCTHPFARSFKNYGGRGITVCKRWRESFENFVKDMGVRPPGMTIERINNNAGYMKSNCRWATRAEQSVNRRNNRLLTFRNKTQPMSVWAKELNICYQTVFNRKKRGLSDARALSTTGTTCDPRKRFLTVQGVFRSVARWAEIKGIDSHLILERLEWGWSPEDAVNTGVEKKRTFRHVRNGT